MPDSIFVNIIRMIKLLLFVFLALTVTIASACDSNCLSCTDTQCNSCAQNYFLQSNTCKSCSNGCKSCSSDTNCNSCVSTYYLDNAKCTKCEQNCQVCTNGTSCIDCFSSFYLSDQSCFACNQYCTECTSSQVCTSCISNYNLVNGKCEYCGSACVQCRDGWYYSNGACRLCNDECLSCVSSTNCSSCAPGFYFSNYTCVSCAGCGDPAYCKTFGVCQAKSTDSSQSQSSNWPTILLVVLVPIVGIIILFGIIYLIVHKASSKDVKSQTTQKVGSVSKSTIPTVGTQNQLGTNARIELQQDKISHVVSVNVGNK